MRCSLISDLIGRCVRFVAYRTTRRYHSFTSTSLEPGYYDLDTRMLHMCMDMLAEYVELEMALLYQYRAITFKRLLNRMLPWCLRVKSWEKSRNEGLAQLDIEAAFYDTPEQAANSREVQALYIWWKDIRPKRTYPLDEIPDDCENFDAVEEYCRKADALQQQYDEEDKQMLIRLIAIRQSLWS